MGVVVYMMMTGKVPFNGMSKFELFANIKKANFTLPKKFSSDLQDLLK